MAAAGSRKTFGECAAALIAAKAPGWRSGAHKAQWRTTLETYCAPIWNHPADEVDTAAVLAILQPVWSRIPETASRLRGRIEAVIDFAKARKLRTGENPATWRGNLAHLLSKRQKLDREHFAAMPYPEVPAFLEALRQLDGMAAIALQFCILTAARSGEVRGAHWDEFDLESKVWTIPAARMKAGREHRVPLSGPAMAILERLAEAKISEFVFAGQRRGKTLSISAMLGVLSRMKIEGVTVHGFRSSFRDWAGEMTSFPRELAEQASAYATGNAVEQSYRRGDALEKRRVLMEAWSTYCEAEKGSNVVPMTRC